MTKKILLFILFHVLAWQTIARADDSLSPRKHVLILIHSRTGNTLAAAEKIKAGLVHNKLIQVDIKRVASHTLLPPISDAVATLPIASIGELVSYDHIIFGSPIYFFAPSAEMMAFLQDGLDLWRNQSLKGKQVAVFFSSNGNGVTFASDTLRTLLRALHMDSDALPNWCSSNSNDWEAFGVCLSQRMTAPPAPFPPVDLPPVPTPVGAYKPYRIANNLVYINQIALWDGKILFPGTVGVDITDEQAKTSTRHAMLNVLAVLNQAVNGDLSRVKQVVEISGFYNAKHGYTQHSSLLNEASSLATLFFGAERGSHTRAVFGVSSLPLNSPVELKAIFEITP